MKRLLATAITLLLLILFSRDAAALDRIVEVLAVGVTDNAGAVLPSGTVTVYDAGTTNLRTIYTDFALSSPAANPLTLDAAGRSVVYTDKRVKLLIKDRYGSTVRTIDNVGTADTDLGVATASALAGNGLTAPGDGTLAVNPDGISTALTGAKLQVKAGYTGAGEYTNGLIAASVGSSALTIALKNNAGNDPSSAAPVSISFRSATLTSGSYASRTVVAALSTVISSGSTAGHTNAVAWPIYVYALDNAGTVELAWSTSPVDERVLQSTTAEGGAGAADSAAVLYSTTARTGVAVRLLSAMLSTQATVGTWAAVPTQISPTSSPWPAATAIARPAATTIGIAGVAASTSSGAFSIPSSSFTDVTNLTVTITTSGRPVRLFLQGVGGGSSSSFSSTVSGAAIFILLRGVTEIARVTFGATVITPPGIDIIDRGLAAGTYTYKVQAAQTSGSGAVSNVILVAYEI